MKKNSNCLEEQFRNCNCGVDDVTHEKLNKQNKGNLDIFSVNVSSRPSGPLVPTALCIFPRREAGSSAGFCRGFLPSGIITHIIFHHVLNLNPGGEQVRIMAARSALTRLLQTKLVTYFWDVWWIMVWNGGNVNGPCNHTFTAMIL